MTALSGHIREFFDRPVLRTIVLGLPLALLVVVSTWEIATALRSDGDVPSDADWDRAAEVVRQHWQEGELVVVAPRWLDPKLRQSVGDLMSLDMAGRMDADRFTKIWEFSARGERAPETVGLTRVTTQRFGSLELHSYEQTPVVVTTDFTERFEPSRVAGKVARRVEVVLEEVGFDPHRCIRVVPQPGQTVTVAYPGSRLGRTIVGYVGLADVFTRRDIRDPARLDVRVNGTSVAQTTVGVDDGWVRFEAATQPGTDEVVFAVTALGEHARNRLVCFAAEARQ